MCIHNQCIREKKRKKIGIPQHTSVLLYNTGFERGYICHGHVFMMEPSKGTGRQRSGKGAIRKRFPLQNPRWEKTN